MIVGGLSIGLLSSKSHIYDAKDKKVNFKGDIEMPITDVSKFFYRYREDKVFVVGQ